MPDTPNTDLIARLRASFPPTDVKLEAADAIEALAAELEKVRADCNAWATNYAELQAELARVRAERRREPTP